MDQNYNPYQVQIENIDKAIAENQALLEDDELKDLAIEEIARLLEEKKAMELAATNFASNQNKSESNDSEEITENANAIIEIRGGAGGDEAKIWANDLMRMYTRYAESKNLKVELIDELVFKVKGRAELPIVEIDEDGKVNKTGETEILSAYKLFRYDSGVHRVQRVPSTESAGRIHTSTASVAVLPEVTATAVEIREEDLEWSFMRAGGAGGQSVNKTSSAVRLVHKPSGLVVNSRTERKQAQNRQIALELLRSQLWQIEEDKKDAQIGEARSNIGRNMRAEKIKTYNYPQSRVTDHRIHQSWHNLEGILEGNLDELIASTKSLIEIDEKSDNEKEIEQN
ncbi:MAG: Peptide chain release factor 1 [Candidatus Pacebacteria bacterium GW2011_GWF2_38_9]|nr:MAG: peptide chain release factor 1, peptide chain release factor 1 [candidate division TM6 bacterium GW2011_GWF2_28_16]KKQ08850.1 MAG: Peptide chain release factor 1 [Candidatus Pacebacteria bacterium GW2011_GWF1_36_5]KKQ89119.1 MAG: Peptide chain release factor 1 [Candidatus Pacebacteria bacterium GW2011_GWF2_38_9]HAZ73619.1 peptide chain release factor 1 [Candidatus Paceibacterota bacterium]